MQIYPGFATHYHETVMGIRDTYSIFVMEMASSQ